ncbi:MAG: potassium channel family protein [Candidatus Micrarchaeota archaeon]
MASLDQVKKHLFNAALMILIIYAIAVPFYMKVEEFSFVDSIYFISTTITTVGYGDLAPQTDIGKVFTILVLFSGVSIFFYHVTHFGILREHTIDPHVQKRFAVLKHLTELHGGNVRKEEVRLIKDKLRRISKEHLKQ